jgi:hypothetical protein
LKHGGRSFPVRARCEGNEEMLHLLSRRCCGGPREKKTSLALDPACGRNSLLVERGDIVGLGHGLNGLNSHGTYIQADSELFKWYRHEAVDIDATG